mgnify:CR=1 FL=1
MLILLVKLGNAFESVEWFPKASGEHLLLVKLGSAFESVEWFPKESGEHPWKDRPFNNRF